MSKGSLNTESNNNVLASSIESWPCHQIAAVVDGLLCGLVGKIVVRPEENCKRLVGDEFDRTGGGCGLA